ncbi:MCE family protein [Rhodocyclus tenuis]|uniref:MCE family protein n=1 Tax=Rhodocyclus gracilis TaxID=2929842 RepID=A0ABX0WEJ3_9RHOO|nr:MlaD family protein [Rhodocyclus gracilis]NJA87800.1 MCE family protein [Rhodocyclus gracilis]
MENRSHALIAGVFTLSLLLAVVASLWWFGGKREVTRDYIVVARQNVTGLGPQGQVRYRGIGVGKVQSITLDPKDPRNIFVRISVNENVPVTRGTTAKLDYQGITGIAYVLLEDTGGDPTPLLGNADNPPRIAMQTSLIEELSQVGGEAMRQARDLLTSMNLLLGGENRQHLTSALASADNGARDVAQVAAQLRQLLSPENVRALSVSLNRLESASAEASPLVADARATLASVKASSDKLDRALGDASSGGAGALPPRVNEVLTDLATTSRQLNRVLQQLESSPQSLVFGPPAAAPGPGEAGFVAPPLRQTP